MFESILGTIIGFGLLIMIIAPKLQPLINRRDQRERDEAIKTAMREEMREQEKRDALSRIAEVITRHWFDLRTKNRRYDVRNNVLAISYAIQLLNSGEPVPVETLCSFLAPLKGGDIVIEELKGMGA